MWDSYDAAVGTPRRKGQGPPFPQGKKEMRLCGDFRCGGSPAR